MAKDKKVEGEQLEEGAGVDAGAQTDAKAKVEMMDTPFYKGPRKAHWPADFVPSGDLAADTKALLMAGPQTQFMVPMAPGDEPGATEMVQINGYKLTIKKGSMVTLPVPMALLLSEKYNVELALQEKSLAARGVKIAALEE